MQCDYCSSIRLVNTIFWNDMPDEISYRPTPVTVTYSDIQGGWPGEGNIDIDPLFADPYNGDFHLKSQAGRWDEFSESWVIDDVTSPCIDAGDPNSSVAFEPFPNGVIINIGVYGNTVEASKSPSGFHTKYSGGTGEPNDPYQIATAEDLMLLGESPEDYDKHFMLIADIDLDPNLPGRKVFDRAIIAPDTNDMESGFQGTSFAGSLDGNDYAITNLTISGRGYLGLFGHVGLGAMISNLGLEAVDVNGTSDDIGGLAAYNEGHLTKNYCTGTVNGDDEVGGLLGNNLGYVTECYSTGSVSGDESVGGLVGYNSGSITTSYSTGTVNGHEDVGGLVSHNSGDIATSYSTGTVNGDEYVGGLVGDNSGSITTSYSTGTVIGNEYVGGLLGLNFSGGQIIRCFSTGLVTGVEDVGGLIGDNYADVTDSFWDMETSTLPYSEGGIGKTTAEMQTASTFLEASWDFVDETENGIEDIWWILEGQDYPRLWWEILE
jgi:hypothetical protein